MHPRRNNILFAKTLYKMNVNPYVNSFGQTVLEDVTLT